MAADAKSVWRLLTPLAVVLVTSLFVGCATHPEDRRPVKRVIARAFTGEKRVDLRKELAFQSEVVETAVFGEPLDILQWKRRYALVRTATGKEGWLDGRVLMRPQDMDALKQIARDFRDTVPMGQGKVYETLNIHTSPSRGSPSFDKLPPDELVDVLGHRVALRAPYKGPVQPEKPVAKKRRKKNDPDEDDAPKVAPPPAPKAPALPADWKQLSQPAGAEEPAVKTSGSKSGVKNAMLLVKAPPVDVGPKYDDWTLVRTKAGGIGWVVSNALTMALPDEVAQYSNRSRITSYFPMGEVVDSEKGRKQHFLWTTISKRAQPYQFDSFRLLIFNTRRHRYETAHWEKDVVGYLPIHVMDPAKGPPSFNLIIEDAGGTFWRKRYIFEGNRVRFLDQTKVDRPRLPTAPEDLPPLELPDTVAQPADENDLSLWARMRRRVLGQ